MAAAAGTGWSRSATELFSGNSPLGELRARLMAGSPLRTLLADQQPDGPDLLVTATHAGLTGWRPVPDRMLIWAQRHSRDNYSMVFGAARLQARAKWADAHELCRIPIG